ncbi:MAG TPA: imidazole glycerol phosphate synthase subunit HisH [Phototrophicaceae bacterium]|jgi:glutamine amidotransferase|nr:imidazole glycerol phosphate synthase subunit HisH [Phototrophicaceae bacterium]
MLAVIDYGAGNLRSVLHALNHLGATNVQLVQKPEDLTGAEKIILPGVGAFGAGMQQLREQQLIEPIRAAVSAGIPYLGICLGMQFLFETSDEMGNHEGLGILPGSVTRFEDRPGLKIPHMGWNQIRVCKPSTLFKDVSEGDFAYFVHSYYCVPANRDDTLAVVDYGIPFTATVHRDNIYGVQFHPEKSQQTGLKILTNFLNL